MLILMEKFWNNSSFSTTYIGYTMHKKIKLVWQFFKFFYYQESWNMCSHNGEETYGQTDRHNLQILHSVFALYAENIQETITQFGFTYMMQSLLTSTYDALI